MLRWRTLVADILCFPKYNVDAAQGSIMHFDSDLHCLWRCPLQFNRRRLPWSQSTNSYNKNQIKNIRRHNGKSKEKWNTEKGKFVAHRYTEYSSPPIWKIGSRIRSGCIPGTTTPPHPLQSQWHAIRSDKFLRAILQAEVETSRL